MTTDSRTTDLLRRATAFADDALISKGALGDVALAVKAAAGRFHSATMLVFDDATGAVIDLDLRGSDSDVLARLTSQTEGANSPAEDNADATDAGEGGPQKRGRPKLGVVAREVTLLPRHWHWLAAQPGGASSALRRLTETAMRDDKSRGAARARKEAAYRFMSAMAGNRAGFEEAARALFADDQSRFAEQSASWPADVRGYARRLGWA